MPQADSAGIFPASGSFSRRISIVFSVVLAVALLGSAFGFWSLLKVSARTGNMVEQVMLTERLAGELHRHILVNVARSNALALSSEPQVGDALTPEISNTTLQISALLQKLENLLSASDESVIFKRVKLANARFVVAMQALNAARDGGLTANIEKVTTTQFAPAAKELQDAVTQLGDSQRVKIDESANEVSELSLKARWGLILFSVCALILGVVLSVWLVRSISRPIELAVNTANQVASLDLTTPIAGHCRDEAGRLLVALGGMQQSLHRLVYEVQEASQKVAEGATQIAAGNLDLSDRTEMTASFLQQTAASIDEISEAMHVSLAAANRAKALVHLANQEATSGSAVMLDVMQTMTDISDSSSQIMEITGVIDGIAFQTNILALNAAVEAARAGEQGRGFAVVAAEVRTLANRSAVAAREIKTLIGHSAGKVKLGTAKVKQAQDTMNTLVRSVDDVNLAISEIHVGSHVQASSMTSVNVAVSKLDKMTQQNAAVVEESAAAARNLHDQASSLREVAGRFKLPGGALALS
jgi:methyl-accepting chemotaxis protein